ncbi:MAG: hypothetical protein ACE5KM_06065 [Planctomycetaceae bacterium]
MYQPTVGRWLSRDPLGVRGQTEIAYSHAYVANRLREQLRPVSPGANQYVYALNSPKSRIDPSGLSSCVLEVAAAKDKRCGPDIDKWLGVEIDVIVKWANQLRPQIKKWVKASNWFERTIGRKDWAYRVTFLGLLGKHLTYFPNTKFFSAVRNVCPTDNCKHTVTLTSKCIHTSEVGNFVFGAAAAAFGFKWSLTDIFGILGNRGKRTDEDKASLEAGYKYALGNQIVTHFLWKNKELHKRMSGGAPEGCENCGDPASSRENHVWLPKVTPQLKDKVFKMAIPKFVWGLGIQV